MHKVKFLIKIAVSALISIVVLCFFSLIYYNPPVATQQSDKITNYKFKENKRWSYMLEGVGYGTTDNLGYNNSYYDNQENPDVVVVGSSHLEALQIPEDSNFVYLLNKMFAEDDLSDNDYKCLNLGISGHFFGVTVSNFEYVIEKYGNARYLIIETDNVKFDEEELEKMLQGEYHTDFEEKNFIYTLAKKIPYFRLLHKKIGELGAEYIEIGEGARAEQTKSYEDKMSKVLNKISAATKEKGIKPIILFHNRINADGNIEADTEYMKIFKACCEEYEIDFIDVTPRFEEEFKNTYKMPYGFSNTVPGEGHLNKFGHKLIAEELYKKLSEKVGL